MSAPIPLRRDFGASQLRGLAKKTKDGPQARRLLALAAIYDGATRTEAAMIGGVGLQIIRDWVLHFNERGPDGLLNGKSPGQPSKLNDVQRQAIARMIESGPIPAVHGVVRWRLIDLAQWIFEEFRIAIAKQTLSRELRAMGYRKLSATAAPPRSSRGRDREFEKSFPTRVETIAREKALDCQTIEIWFADEARMRGCSACSWVSVCRRLATGRWKRSRIGCTRHLRLHRIVGVAWAGNLAAVDPGPAPGFAGCRRNVLFAGRGRPRIAGS